MKQIRNFLKDRSGATAITFALLLVPIMGMTGLAVDYSLASNERSQIAERRRSAALAGASIFTGSNSAAAEARAKAYLKANLGDGSGQGVTIKFTAANQKVNVAISGGTNTLFMHLLKQDKVEIGVNATALAPLKPQLRKSLPVTVYGWYFKKVSIVVVRPGGTTEDTVGTVTYTAKDHSYENGRGRTFILRGIDPTPLNHLKQIGYSAVIKAEQALADGRSEVREREDALAQVGVRHATVRCIGAIPSAAPWTAPENGTPAPQRRHDGRAPERPAALGGRRRAAGVGRAPRRRRVVHDEPGLRLGSIDGVDLRVRRRRGDLRRAATSAPSRCATTTAVRDEADGVYRESAAMDRTRRYRWRMEPVPEHDADEAERQSLIAEGVMRGALRDPVLGRAFLRRMNLLDAPHEILDDPEVAQHARDMREYYASRPPRKVGPDRAELLALIERARPASAVPHDATRQSAATVNVMGTRDEDIATVNMAAEVLEGLAGPLELAMRTARIAREQLVDVTEGAARGLASPVRWSSSRRRSSRGTASTAWTVLVASCSRRSASRSTPSCRPTSSPDLTS